MTEIEKGLIDTEAVKIADAESPFWYTSGTIGPFFINTHYLYGSKETAEDLLSFIDTKMGKAGFRKELFDRVIDRYNSDRLFRTVMDIFYKKLSEDKYFKESVYISGGERRDWFFSPVISHLSGKPHLFIGKDLSIYRCDDDQPVTDINGAVVTHIADLITQASSYERAWIPAIKRINGVMGLSGAIVDRNQGGTDFLERSGVRSIKAVDINDDFFRRLKDSGIIDSKQYVLIESFLKDPIGYGVKFIVENPDFIYNSIKNNQNAKKIKFFFDNNPYNLSNIEDYR